MGEFEAKQLSMCMEIRFMFVSNQVRYLDHATLVFNTLTSGWFWGFLAKKNT